MGSRRQDRELALQLLFSIDINPAPIQNAIKNFTSYFANSEPTPFFLQIVNGVANSCPEIDTFIEKASKNWQINRMSVIDRNILRIGIYELLHCEDIPAKVTINEAIDISKKFGTNDSGAFINGILDKINKEGKEYSKIEGKQDSKIEGKQDGKIEKEQNNKIEEKQDSPVIEPEKKIKKVRRIIR